jgi:hypothetical protein
MRPVLRIADDKIKQPGNTPGKDRRALLAAVSQWLSICGR